MKQGEETIGRARRPLERLGDGLRRLSQRQTANAGVPARGAALVAPPAAPVRAHETRGAVWARGGLALALAPFGSLPPAARGTRARVALAVVALLALAYTLYFTLYLWAAHDAYQTHGEDLGTMDQALWNTVHGAPLHQTVCNIVSDTNCLGDVFRMAIHFEPIMFPLALLYLIAPSPKTLQLVQALIVASGAFPAFWIASRRLGSLAAGVLFAALYLFYPPLQAAVISDFHAVTLSAAFLMFALYFMLTRNNVGLFIAAILALSTKEEVPLDVVMIGLSVALAQRRWRVGGSLVALAVAWLGLALLVTHLASPLGHQPTAGRYAYLGASPAQAALYTLTHPLDVLRHHVFDPVGVTYLRRLLAPYGYLALLSPLTLLLTAPAALVNLLSSDPTMRSGMYQYNAEIAPFVALAAINGVALLVRLASRLAAWASPTLGPLLARAGRLRLRPPDSRLLTRVTLASLALLLLGVGLYQQTRAGYTQANPTVRWPQQTAHTRLADQLVQMIPDDASVSAQSDLLPHVSHRHYIYLYPDQGDEAEYVFLDVTGALYPWTVAPTTYFKSVQALLASGDYGVVAAKDGYLLLKRGAEPATTGDLEALPASFYTFTDAPDTGDTGDPTSGGETLDARFGPSLRLVGYAVNPAPPVYVNSDITVTTYWQVTGPLRGAVCPQLWVRNGAEQTQRFDDFATAQWRPVTTWRPGETLQLRTWPIFLNGGFVGGLQLEAAVSTGACDAANPAYLPHTSSDVAAQDQGAAGDPNGVVFYDAPARTGWLTR